MADSGSTTTLLQPESVLRMGLEVVPRRGAFISYAGGIDVEAIGTTGIGEERAMVVPGIHDNLYSFEQAVERGASVELNKQGGRVISKDGRSMLKLYRIRNSWRVFLNDLKAWRASGGASAPLVDRRCVKCRGMIGGIMPTGSGQSGVPCRCLTPRVVEHGSSSTQERVRGNSGSPLTTSGAALPSLAATLPPVRVKMKRSNKISEPSPYKSNLSVIRT